MIKRTVFAAVLLSFGLSVTAQGPEEKLNALGARFPIEKVYLHTDRDNYISGQTLWFKAYLMQGHLPNESSTVLYVDLLNSQSAIISKLSLPVFGGVSQGQLVLPDSLAGGSYIVRAYTPTQLNSNQDFIFKKIIHITGKNKSVNIHSGNTIRMEFFPEGGNFVVGHPNTIAFKISDENGLPVNAEGTIRNEKDEVVAGFTSYHDGMGMFDINDTKPGSSYYAQISKDVSVRKFHLPQLNDKGIVFRIMNAPGNIQFELFQDTKDKMYQSAYIVGQMEHRVVFRQELKEGQAAINGVINTSKLLSGIMHITVFNKQGMPLAERLAFIDNKEYSIRSSFRTDTLNLKAREKNRFTLTLPDTIAGNFSVAVTDAILNTSVYSSNNILGSLLLTSDLKGYIHEPSWYFRTTKDSSNIAMDLLMMTNGWRRFKWQELPAVNDATGKFTDPGFITLSGRVMLAGTKKSFDNNELIAVVFKADSSKHIVMIKTDDNGYFKLDSLVFFDKARVFFSDIKGKKSKFVEIIPGADSLNRIYPLSKLDHKSLLPYRYEFKDELAQRLSQEYDAIAREEGLVLTEVRIMARKKTPLEELEDKYTTGAFSGDSRQTFDLLNSSEADDFGDIFSFLEARVNGFKASRGADGDLVLYYRQLANMSSLGNIPMQVFLDEVLTDVNAISFLQPRQVAMIKLYTNFVGADGNAPGGALAIYTKKGEDLMSSFTSKGEVMTYKGFSVIREFYSPDYSSLLTDGSKADTRMTLQWIPDVVVKGVNRTIPISFYNNDRTKSFRVVVEGMTVDGKLLSWERIVQ